MLSVMAGSLRALEADMGGIPFKLTDGRDVELDSYYMTETYGGMLEGLPTRDGNESRIRSAKRDLEKLWGKRKVHVVTPKVTPVVPDAFLRADTISRYPNAERMPPFMCWAWIVSFKTVQPDADASGSHAFLIWFQDREAAKLPLVEQAQQVLAGLSWAEIAEDWDP